MKYDKLNGTWLVCSVPFMDKIISPGNKLMGNKNKGKAIKQKLKIKTDSGFLIFKFIDSKISLNFRITW